MPQKEDTRPAQAGDVVFVFGTEDAATNDIVTERMRELDRFEQRRTVLASVVGFSGFLTGVSITLALIFVAEHKTSWLTVGIQFIFLAICLPVMFTAGHRLSKTYDQIEELKKLIGGNANEDAAHVGK